MSTLLLERPPTLFEDVADDAVHREPYGRELVSADVRSVELDGFEVVAVASAHGGLTLDELIAGVWEGLAVRTPVACPVCSGPMRPQRSDEDERPVGGVCGDCGTQLD